MEHSAKPAGTVPDKMLRQALKYIAELENSEAFAWLISGEHEVKERSLRVLLDESADLPAIRFAQGQYQNADVVLHLVERKKAEIKEEMRRRQTEDSEEVAK